jgi:3',5'-cyclic AMP phosphodiesterase CpdA
VTGVRLVHLSDLHFGAHADLAQIGALERLIPELAPSAVVISGDVSQRARHGEFQRALAFIEYCRRTAPVLAVPGNHDVRWWSSPFGIRGEGPKYHHYRRYMGEVLGPVLEVPGAVIVGTVSANGLSFRSVTKNPRDLTVKGHLPNGELDRARTAFSRVSPADCRVLVLHHNVIRGKISNRWGLARPEATQRAIIESGTDLVLCGHDHEEQIAVLRLENGKPGEPAPSEARGRSVVVSQSGTHTDMTRGKRPSVFNLIYISPEEIGVRFMRWNGLAFEPGGEENFPRQRR